MHTKSTFFLLALVAVVFGRTAFAQAPPPPPGPPTPRDELASTIADECLYTNKYNSAQRLSIYPFKKAVKIQLISFTDDGYIPVKNKIINKSRVTEQVTLNAAQTDSLTSILYNVGYTPVKQSLLAVGEAKCYEPRNGILFIDAAGKVFEYIEICFACHRKKTSSSKVKDGEYCETKFDLLQQFFSNAGIKRGTEDKYPILSYEQIFKLDTSEVSFEIRKKLNVKSDNGKEFKKLNASEQTLYFVTNADNIYYSNGGTSAFASFYANFQGNYYTQTLEALHTIGAIRLMNALKVSAKQWPQGIIPKDILKRRAFLLRSINKIYPIWKKLEDGLYDRSAETMGAVELTPKEDLDTLILKYALAHRTALIDH